MTSSHKRSDNVFLATDSLWL